MSLTENQRDQLSHILTHFINDLIETFPDQQTSISSWWSLSDSKPHDLDQIYQECSKRVPTYLPLIYINPGQLFTESTSPVYVLPGIDFRTLWKESSSSPKTRESLVQYTKIMGKLLLLF